MEYKEALKRLPIESIMFEYYADHLGNIFRKHFKQHTFSSQAKEVTKKGYLRVSINDKNLRIHRLIAEAYIPNPDNKPFVNHINGIKWDNRAVNLEWCTTSENMLHYRSIAKIDHSKESERGRRIGSVNSSRQVIQIHPITQMKCIYPSTRSVHALTGITIKSVLNGRQKKAKGYRWEYAK